MKIAICSIAMNESRFVNRWADSAMDADHILLADTGSADETVSLANAHGGIHTHSIHISPWRFDHARNAALSLLPADIDICITLDLDEILTPGWREAIEKAWAPATTRLRYNYVWNWNADGSPNIQFSADRIYSRRGYYWKGPVHEAVVPAPGTVETVSATDAVLIHHHADDSKPRGQYLPLLELAVRENPNDDRAAHYLGREYVFMNRADDAVRELKRHLSLPSATWDEERSASMRLIGKCSRDESRFLRAVAEAPNSRDAWYDLARFRLDGRDFIGALHACQRAIQITQKPTHYLVTQEAWTYGPYDVGCVAAHYCGMKSLAANWWAKAAEMRPDDERIKQNGEWING